MLQKKSSRNNSTPKIQLLDQFANQNIQKDTTKVQPSYKKRCNRFRELDQ